MPVTSQHPTPAALLAYGQGRLSAAEMTAIEAHLSGCDTCCEALAGTPDDTLMVRAREAATSGFRARERTVAEKPANPREIPPPLKDHPRYRVLGLLGAGGMGAVYKAEHRLMERMVALKVINPALVSSPAALERFEREVKTAAKLSHPNIVAAHDAEQAGGLHFLVMEFVEGVSLDRLVAARGPLAPQIAAHLIRQAALGLQHAHTKGMIHRDIKPQNLMVSPPKWDLKILDFGLARLASQAWQSTAEAADGAPDRPENATRAGAILGTPDYIAPEQATDAHLADIRADIYSLGCTLYFLLAGEPPFAGGTMLDKLHAHKSIAPTPIRLRRPEVPEELEQILERALAKDPNQRFATPEEFAKALAPLARAKGATASSGPPLVTPRAIPAATIAEPEPVTPDIVAPLDLAGLDLNLPSIQPAISKSHSGIRSKPRPPQQRLGLLIGGIAVGLVFLLGILWPWLGSGGGDPEKGTARKNELEKIASVKGNQTGKSNQSSSKTPVTPPTSPATNRPTPDNHKPVLMVLPQYSLYYLDYTFVRDALIARGKNFETVSLEGKPVDFYNQEQHPEVKPDHRLTPAIQATDYSAIMFLGYRPQELCEGPGGVQTLRLLTEFEEQKKPVAAICVGQYVLAHHNRLRGKRVALSPAAQTADDTAPVYRNSGFIRESLGVHIDDLLITGSRDTDGPAFVAALLARMQGQQSGSR